MPIDPAHKRSPWKSLLSVLLDAGAEPMDIMLAEVAPGGGDDWDFAFWQYDPDGIMCSYRCPVGRHIWEPTELPAYTGRVRPYERPEEQFSKKPYQGDPDPK